MTPPRKSARKVDPDFEYTWYHPKKVDVKEEQDEKTNVDADPTDVIDQKEEEENVNENDFGETKEETVRPKRTWPQIIDEALMEAEDKRLPTEGVFSYVRQRYPYFTEDAERWEKARRAMRNTLSYGCGYKKVQGNDKEGNIWVLRSYDGPDVVAKSRAKPTLPFCKMCGKVMHHSRPERHELVCGKPHLVSLMLGKITFCRRCGLAFLPSGLKQHDGQCQFEDDANASAANLKTYDEERVKKMWYMFRSKKRGKMKRVGDGADFDSLDASELAAEFNLWHMGRRKKSMKSSFGQEDIAKILWPRFLKEYRMKKKKHGLMADVYGMDMADCDSHLREEFDQWLKEKKNGKSRMIQASHNQICGKCGQAFSRSSVERHEAKCGYLGSEVLCAEDHEHEYIDKAFDSLEDAVAFFYDNEYDSELRIRGTHSKKTSKRPRRFVHYQCARSEKKRVTKAGGSTKQLDHKCPAYISIIENSRRSSFKKTTVTGCVAHNHVDNPTMKRVSWLTKRRIAKYLLLGHSKGEIERDIMPRYHTEGRKKVKIGDVKNVAVVMNAPRDPKHHRLREGLDAMSLVAKDDGDNCLRGVYPWPTDTEKKSPHQPSSLQNPTVSKALQSNASAPTLPRATRVKSRISSKEMNRSCDETEEAVASIAEISADDDASEDPVADNDDGDDAFVESVSEAGAQSPAAAAHSHMEAVADDAIDPEAFRVMRGKVERELTGLLGRVSGLPVSGAGMAELQSILRPSLFDLVITGGSEPPRPPPRPESVMAHERRKLRRRQRALESGKTEPWSKKPRKAMCSRISDEEWAAKMSECI